MPRADLHLHSRYSVSSSEYLVRMMRLNESYTSIDTLYTQAKSRGMDYVTVTDHDTIDGGLELVAKYPRDCFVSVEVTARFPEDNCKAHVLVYDISEQQFAHVQAVRNDIYELRDFLVAEQLPHSLAHATYDMDGVLTVSHLEKFILLFNVFEACNGGRDREQNQGWTRILAELTSEKIDDLFRIHRIEPIGPEPWNKGLTGGSDDHAGVFIGTAWMFANLTALALEPMGHIAGVASSVVMSLTTLMGMPIGLVIASGLGPDDVLALFWGFLAFGALALALIQIAERVRP